LARQSPPLRLKKLFVMGGLLIEQHREQSRSQLAKSAGVNANSVSILKALKGT
jgi:hypothetical protein